MSWFSYKNPSYDTDSETIAGLNVGFSSAENQHIILHNIHQLCAEVGISHKSLALATQIHSANILEVKKGGVYPNIDAFVSNTEGVALGIQVADCGAVLLGDFDNKVIGAAHAGWRGAVAEIVPQTIRSMKELGADEKEIQAFVSPCLSKHNFEVGEEVAARFSEHLINRENYNKPHIDLKGLLFEQLLESGVRSANIEIDERCTIDHEELFYSYRREKEKSGRMMGIIKLNKF
jgi:hypothetical protein